MKLTRNTKLALAGATALVLAINPAAFAGSTLVVGGASSVASIVGDCKVAYTAATGDSFAYASNGSGQGQKDIETGKNDFSFSDSPHLTSQSGKPIPANEIHVPAFVWPIAIEYKDFLSGKPLALSTKTVAAIFAGKRSSIAARMLSNFTKPVAAAKPPSNAALGKGRPICFKAISDAGTIKFFLGSRVAINSAIPNSSKDLRVLIKINP